jgi:zinc D-Ala-D-Ala dipeptidase
MSLVEITPQSHDLVIDLAYATPRNLTGKPIYRRAACYLHPEAAAKLGRAIALALPLGLRLKIFDAFRPSEAQWVLWNACPDPNFLADPRRGSPHSRGAAIDLTLIDVDGRELDMGTAFDAFTPLSHHANTDVSVTAQRHRFLLLGLMSAAGWDFYGNEWWHYQLFNSRQYPLLSDNEAPAPMM